eukprot:CAMPEP_0181475100 /NCGR_PEP_ID=MMETSP1110-20121109/41006_1 /TAXON_ID=174948 /ORGANISM="Symbiodinium sp., Strain CCMP421" /LENGTH=65 /DNA_ID=CAMNT_0023600319 /DNA_START=644 /DNA_END=841 /DNA_ORIENTATION=+
MASALHQAFWLGSTRATVTEGAELVSCFCGAVVQRLAVQSLAFVQVSQLSCLSSSGKIEKRQVHP